MAETPTFGRTSLYKILYDCVFAGKSFLLNLAINALGRERIFLKPTENVFSITIQLAGLL